MEQIENEHQASHVAKMFTKVDLLGIYLVVLM